MRKHFQLKNKKILVTGGAGFIGGHLVEELLNLGAKVLVIDIKVDPLSTFALNKIKKRAVFKNLDVRDRKKVSELVKKFNHNFIIHLAAAPLVTDCYENPYEAFDTNIIGTVNILEAARVFGKGLEGVIIASSDKAYGKTDKPYEENFPLKGDHPYEVSKSSADLITQAYFKTYNLPTVVTRFGNVYGEGDIHFDRIIPGICEAVIKKKTLEVRSDGTYVRDYIYVKDVVQGYITLLKQIQQAKGEAYNFSSSDTLSVVEIIRKSEQILGTKILYKIKNTAQNEIPYQHLNDQKIKKLGWGTKYNLETTLQKVLNWYKKILKP